MTSEIFNRLNAKATEAAIPLQASLELTYRCNERCTHCYIEEFRDDPKRLLNREQWFEVLSKLRKAGTLYLVLMGGEPLLSPHFFDVAERATDLGFHVSMISNGLKIKNVEYAKLLKTVGVKLVNFSLYSLRPEVHDGMTSVKGSLEKLLKAIELCDEQGLKITINGLLTEANSRDIFDLYDWCLDRGYELKVDPNVTPKLNGDLAPTQYRASRESLLWFYRERARRWQNSVPSPVLSGESSFICNAAKGKCAVNPYGELLPCIEIREAFGNLVTEDFETIWFGETAVKWRSPRVKDINNRDDHGLYEFCDHCPGMAKNEHGDPMAMTSYSKMVAEVKRQVFEEFKGIKNDLARP